MKVRGKNLNKTEIHSVKKFLFWNKRIYLLGRDTLASWHTDAKGSLHIENAMNFDF